MIRVYLFIYYLPSVCIFSHSRIVPATWISHFPLKIILVQINKTSGYYRLKRSFGQGNIFTPVCHSVHRGGVPDQACPRDQAGTPPRTRYTPQDQVHPPDHAHPPDQAGTPPEPGRYTPLWDQVHTPPLGPGTPPGPGRYTPWTRYTPQDQAGTPLRGPGTPLGPGRYPPSPKQQTPEYGQRSAGTHPTGMHSCWIKSSSS